MHRPAFLAGQWYPDDADSCRRAIERHCAGPTIETSARGAISPHAGWLFSGDTTGRTLRSIANAHRHATLVVVFGSHRGPDGPNTAFVDDGFETPIGRLETHPLAPRIRDELELEDEPASPTRHDNAVEIQLPFVRALFPEARVVVIGVAASDVGLAIGRRVGELAREAGDNAVFVGSTDLSHYGPNYGWAPRGGGDDAVRWVREVNDRGFLDALLEDRPADAVAHAIEHRSACCPGAAVAALEATRAYAGRVDPAEVDHTLSYDVRPSSSFVGYGGIVF